MEARRGTAQQAADYCKKDGIFDEIGDISKQGQRSDIEEAKQLIINGWNMRSVALNNPVVYVKFHRGLEKFQSRILESRNEVPKVVI